MKPEFSVLITALLISFCLVSQSQAAIRYVTVTGSGTKNGTSWANAYEGLQPALSAAVSGDQVWVAKGTYYPTIKVDGTDERNRTFQMKAGVGIYGGLAGIETDITQRTDFALNGINETILSGDIGTQGNNSDNCYHVIHNTSSLNLTNTAILDGFTITGGNANASVNPHKWGGGINNYQYASPTISNCTFISNTAYNGGGVSNYYYCYPKLTGCSFISNSTYYTSGGLYIGWLSGVTVSDCIFRLNTSSTGAGLYSSSSAVVTNCIFSSNTASSGGGASNSSNSNTVYTNCIFESNTATYGGGMENSQNTALPVLNNCTFTLNTATVSGGGIYNSSDAKPTFNNCIIWGNTSANGKQISIISGTTTLNYSCYSNQSGDIYINAPWATLTASNNCITSDPIFAGTVSNPGHPFSIMGISPCADAGNDSYNTQPYDLRGEGFPRKLNKSNALTGTIDIGTYEFKSGDDSYDFLTWTGTTNSDWGTSSNWNPSRLPLALADVNIPAGLSNYPTLTNAATCHNITLGSNASGTATILDNGHLSVTGTANIKRYFSGNGMDWHLVSSPVANGTAGVFLDMYLQKFFPQPQPSTDPPYSPVWYQDITTPGTPITVMEGYALYSTLADDNTVTFTGNLNTGEKSHPLSHNEANAVYGWNLLGNPFPSTIDWETVEIPGGMSNEVHYISATTGADLAYVKNLGGPGSRYIAPMQGFFVSAPSASSFSLGDAQRSHTGAGNYYKSDNPELVVIEAAGQNLSDQVWIHFNEDAGIEHDGKFDAYKILNSLNPGLPQIFAYTQSGERLAVDGLPEVVPVHLGFTSLNTGEFTLKTLKTGNFSSVKLEDNLSGTTTELVESSYTFTHSPGDSENRFVLRLQKMVGIEYPESSACNVYAQNKTIIIDLPANMHGDITIINLAGQLVSKMSSATGQARISPGHDGVFLVKVVTKRETFTSKVWIH